MLRSSEFTKRLAEVKSMLDARFNLSFRDDAISIHKRMIACNKSDAMRAGLIGLDTDLLNILKYHKRYMNEHSCDNGNGVKYPVSLFDGTYNDEAKNRDAINAYREYIRSMPSRKNMDSIFLKDLNEVCKEYKSSTDYMSRLVRRLLADELTNDGFYKDDDTTRVLILKRFLEVFGYDCPGIRDAALKKIVKRSYDGNISEINDSIFDGGVQTAEPDYVFELVKLQATIIHKSEVISMTGELCKSLKDVVEQSVLSENGLDGSASCLSDCFSVPREFKITDIQNYKNADIEKIKSLNGMLSKRYKAEKKENPEAVDYKAIENRYNGAVNATKDGSLRVIANKMFGINVGRTTLVAMADDLANARFSAQGKSRESLYIFAIAFGMTFGNTDPATKNIKDIEKNLFFDYYADNIVNTKHHNTETVVDGYGINYKNFAEVAFLWVLSKEGKKWPPREKVKAAYLIINDCKKASRKNGEGKIEKEAKEKDKIAITDDYRKLLLDTQFASITDAEQFTNMLAENFDCRAGNAVTAFKNSPVKARMVCTDYAQNVRKNYITAMSMYLDDGIEKELWEIEESYLDFLSMEKYLKEEHCKNCEHFDEKKFPVFPNCDKFCSECVNIYRSAAVDKKRVVLKECREKLQLKRARTRFYRNFYSLSKYCEPEQNEIKEMLKEFENRVKSTLNSLKRGDDLQISRSTILALCFIDFLSARWIECCSETNKVQLKFSDFYNEFVGDGGNGRAFCYYDYDDSLDDNDEIDDEFPDDGFDYDHENETVEEDDAEILEGETDVLDDEADDVEEIDILDEEIVPGVHSELIDANPLWKGGDNGIYEYDFKGANYYLKEAGFQPVNSKNLYDICLVFSAYRDNINRLIVTLYDEIGYRKKRADRILKKNN